MRIKEGVDIRNLTPEILLGAMIARDVLGVYGVETVITAAFDGKHMTNSLHSRGGKCRALDLRSKEIPPAIVQDVIKSLRESLGKQFDVVDETKTTSPHIHMEFDPK